MTPPFEPTERNQNIYARGAVDDKGQLWMEVKAFEVTHSRPATGSFPSMSCVIFEGEEEVGGESIADFVRKHERQAEGRLRAGVRHRTVCARTSYALRRTSRTCLHRDRSQGSADRSALRHLRRRCSQPALALIEIISKLKDPTARIQIPGFYDNVKEPTEPRVESLEELPFDEEEYRKKEVGSNVLTGEEGLFGAVPHMGASDTRSTRNARRIYRPGCEDCIPARIGEGLHAAGA